MKAKVQSAVLDNVKRTAMIVAAAVIMAVNLKTFVRTGGLIPEDSTE